MTITVYHNPDCGTSRNVLALIRNFGEEPEVIEYLKTPPSRERLAELVALMGIRVRDLLREKGTPYAELGLGDSSLSDDALLDAMMAHPILINRPVVVTPLGVKLCRPSEAVLDILPEQQRGVFNIGAATIAQVSLPVTILIWLMVIPMLLKVDLGALRQVTTHWRGMAATVGLV